MTKAKEYHEENTEMNPFVYHTDKKGPVALYGEKKPERDVYPYTINRITKSAFEKDYKAWQKTPIGYAREPEFKVGEFVYYKIWKIKILSIINNLALFEYKGHLGKIGKKEVPLNELSHFQEGQQVEVKGYEELVYTGTTEIAYKDFYQYIDDNPESIKKEFEWQPVEEPEEIIYKPIVESASMHPNEGTEPYLNPKYTEFHNKVKEGEILTIIKKI